MSATPGTGWDCKVVSATDFTSVMGQLSTWESLTMSKTLSDPGGGIITLPLDDPQLGVPIPAGITTTRAVPVLGAYQDALTRTVRWPMYGPSYVTNPQVQTLDIHATYAQTIQVKNWLGVPAGFTAPAGIRLYLWYTDASNHIRIDVGNPYYQIYLVNAGVVTQIGGGNNSFGGGPMVFQVFKSRVGNGGNVYATPSTGGVFTYDGTDLNVSDMTTGIWAGFTRGSKVGWDTTFSGGSGQSIDRSTGKFLAYGEPDTPPSLGAFTGLAGVWDDQYDQGLYANGYGVEIVDGAFQRAWAPWRAASSGSTGEVLVDVAASDGIWEAVIDNYDINYPAYMSLLLRADSSGNAIEAYLGGSGGPGGFQVTAPGFTPTAAVGLSGTAWTNGDLVKVEMLGSTLKFYRNNDLLGTMTITFGVTNTVHGMRVGGHSDASTTTDEDQAANPSLWARYTPRWRYPTFIGSSAVNVTVTPTNLLDDENLWQLYEDGDLRFEFFAEKLDEKVLDGNEHKSVTISGRGTGLVLEWAKTLPPGWPTPTGVDQKFIAKPVMSIWLTLLGAAKGRGTLTFVSTTFTATTDSAGVAWIDLNDITVSPGENLLDLLNKWCATIGADWTMLPGFVLDVRQTAGTHKEDTIVFWPGSEALVQTRARDRGPIKNYVAVKGVNNTYSYAQDTTSIGRYQRREEFLESSDAASSAQRVVVAQASLKSTKDESASLTVAIDPAVEGRKMFSDFDVADWVKIVTDDDYMTGAYRAFALSVSIDEEGEVTGEITLQSRRDIALLKLQRALANIQVGGSSTVTKPIAASTAAAALHLGDLIDVSVINKSSGQYLAWNGSAWVARSFDTSTIGATRLDQLLDVSVSGKTNGQVLTWDNAAGVWLPKSPTAAGAAGGVLGGTYPNPTFAVDMATQAELDAAIIAHVALTDPHTQYALDSDRGVANGYAALDSSGVVPPAQLAPSPTGTSFLRGDKTWAVPYADPLTTKGDLLTRSSSALIRLPAGSDGDVLTVDSTVAAGIKWATGGGGGGSSFTRSTVTFTSSSLAPGAAATGVVVMAVGYRLLRVSTDREARVRVYDTVAARTADASRAVGVDPASGAGVILDVVTTAALLGLDLSPLVDGASMETSPSTSIPIRITNMSTGTSTVAVVFTWIRTE